MTKEEMLREIEKTEKEIEEICKAEEYGFSESLSQRLLILHQYLDTLKMRIPFADGPTYSGTKVDLYLNDEEKQSLSGKYYTITLHDTVKRIGMLRVSLEDVVPFFANIGCEIMPSYRGHHYALEALETIRNHILEQGVSKIKITVYPDNIASIKTIEAFGGKLQPVLEGETWNTYEVDLDQFKKQKMYH